MFREKHKGAAGIHVTISTVVTFGLVFLLISAVAIASAAAKDGLGELTGFNGMSGDITCPADNYSVVARSPASIKAINQNLSFYKEIADITNVPWYVIAAVHYRETNSDTTGKQSYANGFEICNTKNHMTHPDGCSDIKQDAIDAMKHLQSKTGNQLTISTYDPVTLKKVFFAFNGEAGQYVEQARKLGFPESEGYEGSPYVMNNFDTLHRNMGIITKDYGDIDGTDGRDGAYTLAALLISAEFDDTGKIISMGNCQAQATLDTSGYDVFPPLGPQTSKATVNSTPHGAAGHGVFEMGSGFKEDGDAAIDYYLGFSTVYASFSGKVIAQVIPYTSDNYSDGCGASRKCSGGDVIYVSSSDGTMGAVYAHISSSVKKGQSVTKGQAIGTIARKCTKADAANNYAHCQEFAGEAHLHYQLYLNKTALKKAQIIEKFKK